MATQTRKSTTTTTTKTKSKAAPGRTDQARAAAERAVDVPVGVVLEMSDRVAELVEPFSGRTAAQKQLRTYGTRLQRSVKRNVKRSERRGATARRRATTEARKTRSQVEKRIRTTLDEQTSRAQELVGDVTDRVTALSPR